VKELQPLVRGVEHPDFAAPYKVAAPFAFDCDLVVLDTHQALPRIAGGFKPPGFLICSLAR
jgi:hypothetical protein